MSAWFQRLIHLGELQDRLRAEGHEPRMSAARARFLAAADELRERQVAPRWVLGLGGAVAAVALAIGTVQMMDDPTLTFRVGADGDGIAGAWIAAVDREPLPIVFSDGSQVALAQGSRSRIDDLDARGARVILESGAAAIEVVPGRDRAWQVDAGPFAVQVTGTSFTVRWDPARERFHLALHEGSVVVDGPVVGSGNGLEAGQILTVSVREATAVISAEPRPGEAANAPLSTVAANAASTRTAAAPTNGPIDGAVESTATQPRSGRATSRDATEAGASPESAPGNAGWKTLAATGKYSAAWAAARREGLPTLEQVLTATELLRLSDVARFSGHTDDARRILIGLRQRFPGTPSAATAAYDLGRISSEHDRAPSEASTWFGVYLQELPGGGLAREALGRQMEAANAAGQTELARMLARRYMARWPSGTHADVARGLVDP